MILIIAQLLMQFVAGRATSCSVRDFRPFFLKF